MRQILEELTQRKRALIESGYDVFAFDIGQPVGDVLPVARERLQQFAADSGAYGYQPGFGMDSLREIFAERHAKKYELPTPVPRANVLVSRGSKPIFPSLARVMLKPGDCAIVPLVGYAIHYDSVVKVRGNPVTYPCGPGIDVLKSISAAIERAPDAKYVLVNSPHNPTCITVSETFFPKLVQLLKPGMKLIADLAYEDLILSGSPAFSAFQVEGARDKEILETHSMTKGHNISGVGLTIGPHETLQLLSKDMSDDGYGVFLPLQAAAEAALRDEEAVERNCDLYRGIDAILTDGLTSVGWQAKRTKATFYKWLEVPEGWTAEKLCWELLLKAHVSIWPGTGFTNGDQKDKENERERVRFSMVETPERTEKAVEAIRKFFKQQIL